MAKENLNTRLVKKSTITIRGQEVPLLTYKGTNDVGSAGSPNNVRKD